MFLKDGFQFSFGVGPEHRFSPRPRRVKFLKVNS